MWQQGRVKNPALLFICKFGWSHPAIRVGPGPLPARCFPEVDLTHLGPDESIVRVEPYPGARQDS